MRVILSIFVLIIMFAKQAEADTEYLNLEQFVDKKTYYGLYIDEEKIGYAHFTRQLTEERKPLSFLETAYIYLQFAAKNEEVLTIEINMEYHFDISNGKLFLYIEDFKQQTALNNYNLKTGRFNNVEVENLIARLSANGFYEVTETKNNKQSERISKLPILYAKDYLTAEYLILKNAEVGKTVTVEVFDLDFEEQKVISSQISVHDVKSYKNSGTESLNYEIKFADTNLSGTYTSKYDQSARFISGELIGMDFRIEPEDIAKNKDSISHLVLLGELPVDNPLPDDKDITEIYLELIGQELGGGFVENNRQKIVVEKDGWKLVKLTRGGQGYASTNKADISEYLKNTSRLNWKNDLLEFINPSTELSSLNAVDQVKYLLDFTHNYIDYEFTLAATLNEIIENGKGDCTEYAQLFVTLSRLNGIPAREVSGLVYGYGEDDSKFYGHAWAEVWLDNRWLEVDPGWNEFNVDASHLQLSEASIYSFNDEIKVRSFR